MFEAIWISELFKCRDVRTLILDWEALEVGEPDSGWTKVYVLKVGIKFWLHFETFLERDIDGLGLVQVCSYYLYLRILDLLNCVRSNNHQQGHYGYYGKPETCTHCGLVTIIKR